MRLHRFMVDLKLQVGRVELRDEEAASQIRNVLRLRVGDSLILCDGNLGEATAKVLAYKGDRVELQIDDLKQNQNEPTVDVTLYCALLRKENFEVVVQKATELGVGRIVPLLTQRTVKLQTREDRLLKIAKEAAEQSGRGVIPEIAEALEFGAAAIHAKANHSKTFFFSIGSSEFRIQTAGIKPSSKVGIFVGPEGGWDASEIETAKANGFELVGLGPLTLRGETAAIVATYQILAASRV